MEGAQARELLAQEQDRLAGIRDGIVSQGFSDETEAESIAESDNGQHQADVGTETFDRERYRASGALAVCARPGLLEAPFHVGRMCHFVRDTDYGCEMRSRFWLGIISHRDSTITLPEAQVRQMRAENLNAEFARRLHQHSVEEMGYLGEILPTLYRRVTLDNVY